MTKLLMIVMTTLGSYVGWALGAYLSDDITIAFFLSGLGMMAGVVVAWWMQQRMDG